MALLEPDSTAECLPLQSPTPLLQGHNYLYTTYPSPPLPITFILQAMFNAVNC